MINKYLMIAGMVLLPLTYSHSVLATAAVDELLAQYRSAGATEFSAEAGKTLWLQEFKDAKSEKVRQCATCHTDNLRNKGKHARTGKPIEPLATSVNPKSLTDIKKVRKWLTRNCKWTIGRECTPQEKGNVLTFIQAQ
jgi:mono/diheme cytochrome c family protein